MIKNLLFFSRFPIVAVTLILATLIYLAFDADTAQETTKPQHDISATQNTLEHNALRPKEVLATNRVLSDSDKVTAYRQFIMNLPTYLADTELPNHYETDEHGNLIINDSVKSIFDYFLLTVGDLSFEEIYNITSGHIISSLKPPALEQALDILTSYFHYIDDYDKWLTSLENRHGLTDPTAQLALLEELKAIRQQHFSNDVYNIFFLELEQTNKSYLQAKIALNQADLSAQEKAAIITELTESLPASVTSAQQAAQVQVNLEKETQTLIKANAPKSAIYRLRQDLVGQEAAIRLDEVDSARAAWQLKRQQYLSLISSTLGLEGLSDSEKSDYINEIAQQELGLTDQDMLRMRALDRIEGE